MLDTRIAIGTGIATALAAIAIAAPVGAAHPLDDPHDRTRPARTIMPAWQVALELRSEALNRRYGLDQSAASASSGGAEAAWKRALFMRSQALNRKYGLGEFAKVGG